MNKPRILLADDHRIVLDGLRGLLSGEFDLVGVVSDGREMIEACRRLRPDVVVADVSMPLLNGVDAARILRDDGSRSRIVFLTMHSDLDYAARALEAGASGYVLKHAASDELVTAIHEVLAGRKYLSPALRTPAVLELLAGGRPHTRQTIHLTARQIEVLQLLAEGRSAKEIGGILNVSSRTVEFHKYKMMDELGVHSSAELVQYAIRHGLVSV
ncbi:MAG: response regulator transcription factor [Bryobacterales bacterium]|nr:response regulator transcription factor [Bryobacterales bacterium]